MNSIAETCLKLESPFPIVATIHARLANPPDVCSRIKLGYRDPATIDVESFANQEPEGILLVRKAGEYLYRLKSKS